MYNSSLALCFGELVRMGFPITFNRENELVVFDLGILLVFCSSEKFYIKDEFGHDYVLSSVDSFYSIFHQR